jgi:hypothetical protein
MHFPAFPAMPTQPSTFFPLFYLKVLSTLLQPFVYLSLATTFVSASQQHSTALALRNMRTA